MSARFEQPVVSVLVPVHNGGALIGEALASIAAQVDAPSLEIIVINDRSDDPATLQALAAAASAANVRVVDSDAAPGPAGARNVGLQHARGEWLAFLDADDRWPPDSLATRFAALQANLTIDWVVGGLLNWDANTGELAENSDPLRARARASGDPGNAILVRDAMRVLAAPPFLRLGAMLVRRKALKDIGGFDVRFRYGEDWLSWLHLATRGPLLYVDTVALHLRRHGASLTQDAAAMEQGWRATRHVLREAALRPVRRQLRWTLARQLANAAEAMAAQGLRGRALGYAGRAWLAVPNSLEHWRRVWRLLFRKL